MAGAGNEKTSTATGNVAKVNAAERTLTVTLADGSETRFLWTADTKISGTLAPGAKVTIRYTTLSDGQNLAHQISVSRN
jgi:YD repeat-containing protein